MKVILVLLGVAAVAGLAVVIVGRADARRQGEAFGFGAVGGAIRGIVDGLQSSGTGGTEPGSQSGASGFIRGLRSATLE